jgi:cobalt-zinc-cadmium efflux system membrane fusion protein
METSQKKQNWGPAGITSLLITFVVGLALGAFVYSRLLGTGPFVQLSDEPVETKQVIELDTSPDFVEISPETQKEVGIAVEPAAFRNLPDTLSATGTISEDPGQVAHIRPLARGVIERSYVRLGDRVSAGDPLVEYDNIELGLAIGEYLGAQAELQRSLTDLEVKKTILERGKEMLSVGAIARTAYDLRKAEYRDAEARTAGARATVAKIEEQIYRFGWTDQDLKSLPAKQGSGHSISHSVLKAPFSGIITNYHASIGEVVEPSTELITITDMSSLWVLADVFEKDLSNIQTGKAVQVRVASYPGRVFQGRITYVADIIDPKTRTAKVRCVAENKAGLLKLEMFAAIEIPVDRASSVLAVPDSSIQQIEGKPVVFVRKSENEFEKRHVQTGITGGGYTEIRSGLKAGELVASQGSFVVKTAFLRDLIGEEE